MSNGIDRGLEQRDKEYLGDGVYVGHDGFQFWLSVEDGVVAREAIAMDREVILELYNYAERIIRKYQGDAK